MPIKQYGLSKEFLQEFFLSGIKKIISARKEMLMTQMIWIIMTCITMLEMQRVLMKTILIRKHWYSIRDVDSQPKCHQGSH